jgi:SAM-dependent methyltransferase
MNKQTQKELLDMVRRNYEDIADEYHETRKKHLEPLWHNLIKLAKEVKDKERVLDIGCGNGRLLEAFLGKEIDYLGIDTNEKLLAYAKERYPGRNFLVGDILKLGELIELNFDHVFAMAVFHHLPGKELRIQALRQLKNKIKNNGRIVITVWNLWGQKKFRKIIFKFAILKLMKKNKMGFGDILFPGFNLRSQRYYHAFSQRGLKKIVKKAGLKVDSIYKDKYNYYIIAKK